jgi:hypothetical protein
MGVSRRLGHAICFDCDLVGQRGILLMILSVNLELGVRMTKHVVGWSTGCKCPVVYNIREGGRRSGKATISMKCYYDLEDNQMKNL